MKISLSRTGLTVLGIVAALSIALSAVSYVVSSNASQDIQEIASEESRSVARTSAHDLGVSLSNKFGSVASNLEILANAPLIVSGDAESQPLFEAAQSSTADLTDGYYLLNRQGVIVTHSDLGTGRYPDYRGDDLSFRDYFQIPRDTGAPYNTDVLDSRDGALRMYMSHPLFSPDGAFAGVVVASVSAAALGPILESQALPEIESYVSVLGKEGRLITARLPELIGENHFGEKVQSLVYGPVIPEEQRESHNSFVRQSLEGGSGYADFTILGTQTTVTYSPVMVSGQHFFTLYVSVPHHFTANVAALAERESGFSMLVTVVSGIITIFVAFLVLSWNRNLENIVKKRTSELKFSNRRLAESNEQLAQANSLLAIQNERLQENDKMQKEFINIAAHELRTPIQPLLGIADLIEVPEDGRKDGTGKIAVTRAEVEMIIRNAKRLERLSSDILEVSRIESKSLKLDREVFDLNDVVATAISDARGALPAETRRIQIVFVPKAGSIPVRADKGRILQVLANILGNAVKFTGDGGMISVSTSKDEQAAVVDVKDSGPGIDPGMMARLFQKFATNSEAGTGLGLFISKSIIETHGGRIHARNNEDGQGATFSFALPLAGREKRAVQDS